MRCIDAEDPDKEEPEDWEPPRDMDVAWAVWCLQTASGWKHNLVDGGMLDQPEALTQDVAVIEWLSGIIGPEVRRRKGRE